MYGGPGGGGGFPYDSGYNSNYTFPNLANLAAVQAAQAAGNAVTAVSGGAAASSVSKN